MAVLIADKNDRQKLYAIVFACLQIPCCLFLFAIIVPLYKVAKERTALYILLSKVTRNVTIFYSIFIQTCFNIVSQLSNCIYQNLWAFNNNQLGIFSEIYPRWSQCLAMIISIHVLALAVNRFIAVFFAFKYLRIFDKRYVDQLEYQKKPFSGTHFCALLLFGLLELHWDSRKEQWENFSLI